MLLLTLHHIVSDGWSMGIFYDELTTLYAAFLADRPSPLSELPIQYVDFAAWQRQWLKGETLDELLSYWRSQLAGIPPVLELPTDRPRPAMQTLHGSYLRFVLPQPLAEQLLALSLREGVTLFMTLLAAFQALLYHYTGQEDIVVGTPIAGRTRTELEGLIGCFINTLVLRSKISGSATFRELLSQVREVSVGAYAHQDLPFEQLVEALQPERNLSHPPLFQVMFVLQNAPITTSDLTGLKLRPLRAQNDTAKFDITLFFEEAEQGLVGALEYNSDLFDAATILRMQHHFQRLLEGIVTHPDQPLRELPLLSEAERQQLLVEWNATEAEYPREQCIQHVFEEQVEQTPDAVAVIFEGEQLTYRELNRRANQLAFYLQKQGVRQETLVGLCMERSVEMLVSLFGILKAGAAYVPLDPAYPRQRLAFMVTDAQVSLLLTRQRLVELLPEQRVPIISLDAHWEAIAIEEGGNLARSISADNLCYVIYTSGSTGQPKGVQVLHNAVVNFLTSMQRQIGLLDQDILLAVTTLSFDIAALELLLPLTIGARVVILRREVISDGIQLAAQISASRATIMQATPATWRLLLEAGWPGSSQLKILCGGETLPFELAKQLLERGASLWNLYGPTETTIWSLAHQIEPRDESVYIGRPIANTQVYLLDSQLQPVLLGISGEIYIGGVGVARGYLNRPELTAARFVPHPYSSEPGARLYRTGDLARYLSNGDLEYLGRTDQQVKIRGFRIELGEVEAALTEHPDVQESVVLAHEETPGEKRLVAYVVPQAEQRLTVRDLRRYLKENLPDYMVPSAFVMLKALPLTSNGKVDRRALPTPDGVRPELEEAYVAPGTPIEEALAKILIQVLQQERIGIHDNFFDLGGHSLLATQIVVRIRDTFQVELPLRSLFLAPTLAGIAEQIEAIRRTTQSPRTTPSIKRLPRSLR